MKQESPDQRLLRRWLSAQATGTIPAELYREVEAAPASFRILAAREMGESAGPVATFWSRVRPHLPAPVRVRVPLPFTTGRRGLALLNLVRGHEHEFEVASALVSVATNRHAENRRVALLALGSLLVIPPELAEPLASLAGETDYVLRLEAATTLRNATPRTSPVEQALRRLAADPIAAVRRAARAPDDDEPETATP